MKEMWRPISDRPPPEGISILIVSAGTCRIAILVVGDGPEGQWQAFMDPHTDELYPWPTHWMPLPEAPEMS
jgi:hypothetical protein